MRKLFLSGMVILLAFSVVFMACQQEGLPTLNGFRIYDPVKARGGVILSWEPVVDANGYDVYRQRIWDPTNGNVNGDHVKLETIGRDVFKFADFKGKYSDLTLGRYRYTVVALSGTSTMWDRSVVQNSQQAVDVLFEGSDLTVSLTAPNFTLTPAPDKDFGGVFVSWNADSNPFVTYDVSYTVVQDTVYSDIDSDIDGTETFIYVGDTSIKSAFVTVSVTKKLGSYNPVTAAAKTTDVYGDGGVIGTGSIIATRDSKAVTLEIPVFNELPYTGYYTLTRITKKADGTYNPPAAVTAAAQKIVKSDGKAYYRVIDTAAAADTGASYRAIVKSGNDFVAVYVGTIDGFAVNSLQALNLKADRMVWAISYTESRDTSWGTVYLRFNWESDVDYRVYRKQTTLPNYVPVTSIPGVVFDWVAFPFPVRTTPPLGTSNYTDCLDVTSTAAANPSERVYEVNIPNARTGYAFKVEAIGKGSKAGYKGTSQIVYVDNSNAPDYPYSQGSLINYYQPIEPIGYFGTPTYSLTSNGGTVTSYYLTDSTRYGGRINVYKDGGSWYRDFGDITALNYETRIVDGDDTIGVGLSVNLTGIRTLSGGERILRNNETLRIEFIPINDAPQKTPITLAWNDGPWDALTDNYYFVLPVSEEVFVDDYYASYDVKLVITVPKPNNY